MTLTRFVLADDKARAIYYAQYNSRHDPLRIRLALSVGQWSEQATPTDRTAFALELWASDKNYHITVVDAGQNPWHEVAFLGAMLNREQALSHPLYAEVLHISEAILAQDAAIVEIFAGMPGANG